MGLLWEFKGTFFVIAVVAILVVLSIIGSWERYTPRDLQIHVEDELDSIHGVDRVDFEQQSTTWLPGAMTYSQVYDVDHSGIEELTVTMTHTANRTKSLVELVLNADQTEQDVIEDRLAYVESGGNQSVIGYYRGSALRLRFSDAVSRDEAEAIGKEYFSTLRSEVDRIDNSTIVYRPYFRPVTELDVVASTLEALVPTEMYPEPDLPELGRTEGVTVY